MARPPKDPEDRRDDQLNIRLSDRERVRLEYRAAALGITLAEFMRDRGLGYRLSRRAAERQADALTLATLNRLGVNLNQLTHYAHVGWLTPGTDAALHEVLTEIQATMRGLRRGPKTNPRGPEL